MALTPDPYRVWYATVHLGPYPITIKMTEAFATLNTSLGAFRDDDTFTYSKAIAEDIIAKEEILSTYIPGGGLHHWP